MYAWYSLLIEEIFSCNSGETTHVSPTSTTPAASMAMLVCVDGLASYVTRSRGSSAPRSVSWPTGRP